jgi:hypothetical protein
VGLERGLGESVVFETDRPGLPERRRRNDDVKMRNETLAREEKFHGWQIRKPHDAAVGKEENWGRFACSRAAKALQFWPSVERGNLNTELCNAVGR